MIPEYLSNPCARVIFDAGGADEATWRRQVTSPGRAGVAVELHWRC